MVPRSQAIELDMSIDAAMKMIVTLGCGRCRRRPAGMHPAAIVPRRAPEFPRT